MLFLKVGGTATRSAIPSPTAVVSLVLRFIPTKRVGESDRGVVSDTEICMADKLVAIVTVSVTGVVSETRMNEITSMVGVSDTGVVSVAVANIGTCKIGVSDTAVTSKTFTP